MQKHIHLHKNLSLMDTETTDKEASQEKSLWEEYSSFHDSFTELLSYENSRKSRSDIWQLNYI